MSIKRNLAEDFMTKKEKTDVKNEEVADSKEIEKEIQHKPLEKLTTEVDNVRKVNDGYLFDLYIKEKDLSLKNVFFPLKSIYTSENLRIRAQLKRSREIKRKIVTYFLIYPAAIVSLVVIISGFSKMYDFIKRTFDTTGFSF